MACVGRARASGVASSSCATTRFTFFDDDEVD
jgi:hypothetical protein